MVFNIFVTDERDLPSDPTQLEVSDNQSVRSDSDTLEEAKAQLQRCVPVRTQFLYLDIFLMNFVSNTILKTVEIYSTYIRNCTTLNMDYMISYIFVPRGMNH